MKRPLIIYKIRRMQEDWDRGVSTALSPPTKRTIARAAANTRRECIAPNLARILLAASQYLPFAPLPPHRLGSC